jgi:hypothetical protein
MAGRWKILLLFFVGITSLYPVLGFGQDSTTIELKEDEDKLALTEETNLPSAATQSQLDELNQKQKFDTVKSELKLRDWLSKLLKPKDDKISENKPLATPNFQGIEKFIKSIAYIVFALITLSLIYFIFKDIKLNLSSDKKISLNIDLDNIENIQTVDLEKLLKQSLDNNEYRMAIRLRYLIILQSLAKKEIIHWKPEKTNRMYVSEVKLSPFLQEFKQLTLIFEKVWYGGEGIEDAKYRSLEPLFDNLNNRVVGYGQ